jgi:hypothetical protein
MNHGVHDVLETIKHILIHTYKTIEILITQNGIVLQIKANIKPRQNSSKLINTTPLFENMLKSVFYVHFITITIMLLKFNIIKLNFVENKVSYSLSKSKPMCTPHSQNFAPIYVYAVTGFNSKGSLLNMKHTGCAEHKKII